MTILERVEIVGFKSFADMAAFDLVPGINCIVGPGGIGKSNVLDAIEWVLGGNEKNPGNDSVKSLGILNINKGGQAELAEVALTFSKTAKFSPDREVFVIARRKFITGRCDYLLNGKLCIEKTVKEYLNGPAGDFSYCFYEQKPSTGLLSASDFYLECLSRFITKIKKQNISLCIFDDADARLNREVILKFKELLSSLSKRIQVIIVCDTAELESLADITHRLSMSDDATISEQVYSLRYIVNATIRRLFAWIHYKVKKLFEK